MDMGSALILLSLATAYGGITTMLWNRRRGLQQVGALLLLASLVLVILATTTLPY